MLRVLSKSDYKVRTIDPEEITDRDWRLPADAVWIDLVSPSRAEELVMEAALGVNLPTREEMAEIEVSSRLYQDKGATFMIATLLANADGDQPKAVPVTFVIVSDHLVTIRYDEPRAFVAFASSVERQPDLAENGADAFVGLLDAIVDRISEVLEGASAEVESISGAIFSKHRVGALEDILERLGRVNMLAGKARESLVSLSRLLSYAALAPEMAAHKDCQDHLASLQHDVQSLTDHVGYQTSTVGFLLDAALGFIGIEQNSISKIFSVVSVLFLPATLIAGIYGMNFENIPELKQPLGYFFAIGAILLVMIIPLVWMRRRRWI